MKIPDCSFCLLYARDPHLVCTVHPTGVETSSCPDFEPDPNAEPEELWQPEGASYYKGELILIREPRLTPEEQLELLDSHPLFTGRCPQCEMPFPKHDCPPIHWDCPHCGWRDNSV